MNSIIRVGSLAVLVAVLFSSVSYATDLRCKNCVGGSQLKRRSVTASKIKDGSVTKAKLGPDVKVVGLEGVTVVGPAEFTPDGGNTNCFFDDDNQVWLLGSAISGICCLQSAARLPNGVTISSFEATAKFTGSTIVDVDLNAKVVGSGGRKVPIASANFTPSSSLQTVTVSSLSSVVDSTTTSYSISLCINRLEDEFHGVRVLFQ